MDRWIDTTGGPHIIIEEKLRSKWRGVENSHYEKACEVDGYQGYIMLDGISAVILGDMPGSAKFYSTDQSNFSCVCWVAADSEKEVEEKYFGVGNALPPDAETMQVEFDSGQIALFDSSYPGDEADIAVLTIQPGRYNVYSFPILESTDEGTLIIIVHRFERIGEG